jgi:DDE superfamily endonuclease
VRFIVLFIFIGIVDSTYIRIAQPFANFAAYTCRKNFCAVILQVTCDKRLKFTSVSTGWPGSMHDTRVFQNSAIGQQLNDLLGGN